MKYSVQEVLLSHLKITLSSGL